jgi:hypothetical protein
LQPPRKPKVLDVYYHLTWDNKLREKFEKWKESNAIAEQDVLRHRNQFVNKALEEEDEAYHEMIMAKVEKDHQSALVKWKKILDSTKAVNAEDDT